jgi:hypothetical protein
MAGLERKVKAIRRQTKQAEKRAAKTAKKRERKAALLTGSVRKELSK